MGLMSHRRRSRDGIEGFDLSHLRTPPRPWAEAARAIALVFCEGAVVKNRVPKYNYVYENSTCCVLKFQGNGPEYPFFQ